MFDLSEKVLVWIPVRWKGLQPNGDDLAEPVEHEITVLAEIVDKARLKELFPRMNLTADDLVDGRIPEAPDEVELFMALVSDWKGVRDGPNPVPFTRENVERLLRVPMFAPGFEESYSEAWTGRLELREKNSEGSLNGGRADEAGAKASRSSTTRRRGR